MRLGLIPVLQALILLAVLPSSSSASICATSSTNSGSYQCEAFQTEPVVDAVVR